ncbi:MAG: phosphoribosylglycinamide formyltransferase [Flavobacteriaceae bacterium]
MKRIVLMASGSGSNVENIARFFEEHHSIKVVAVLTNKRDAYVIDRCNKLNISVLYFNRFAYSHSDIVLNLLKGIDPHLIVLAGFLWKVPENIVQSFDGKIINIHPALLPKYGGKGMYGRYVHEKVKESGDSESGITIHYVDENYDEGNIIFQARVGVENNDSVDDIAEKVHRLEYEHFPKIIEQLLKDSNG